MPPPTFDGNSLLIVLPAATPTIDVLGDLYSEWKKWQLLGDNLRYELAFEPSGGRQTQPGETEGQNTFFRNDLGWRIRPAEEDGAYNFVGNLFPADVTLPILIPTIGDFTVLITATRSSLSLVKETGVSGMTPVEATRHLEMWQRLQLDPDNAVIDTPADVSFAGIVIDRTGDGVSTTTSTRRP